MERKQHGAGTWTVIRHCQDSKRGNEEGENHNGGTCQAEVKGVVFGMSYENIGGVENRPALGGGEKNSPKVYTRYGQTISVDSTPPEI